MLYRGFNVKIIPAKNIARESDGKKVLCGGFIIEIYHNSAERILLDRFTAAAGYELSRCSFREAEEFAQDVIDSEEKEYLHIVEFEKEIKNCI